MLEPSGALLEHKQFIRRHIGPDQSDQQTMLATLEVDSLQSLIQQTVPEAIRLADDALPCFSSMSENETLTQLKAFAKSNQPLKSCLGQGYYGTYTPTVIQRNVLENPGWYTAYTPYQAEISQGRLESLLNFQQMVTDLTAMELANASLLDEGTAAAEAMAMCQRAGRSKSLNFLIAEDTHLQTIEVVKTRADHFGYKVFVQEPLSALDHEDYFALLLQYPNTYGSIEDLTQLIDKAHDKGMLVIVATDLLALTLLKAPGEMGADVVVGTSQRFGVPMGFGGPHAAFIATKEKYKRSLPGRIIGVSKSKSGEPVLRMAMQTREQHIRREKATSNLCTAQALLANMASFYAVYHGPKGLKNIALRVNELTAYLAKGLSRAGLAVVNQHSFDTLTFASKEKTKDLLGNALAAGFNIRQVDEKHLAISLDETFSVQEVDKLVQALTGLSVEADNLPSLLPKDCLRTSDYLTHPVFHLYHSETEMLRYLKRLENKDFSLAHGMIPLGSCTMKLNASTEMMPLSWPEFAQMHPFAPFDQAEGYLELIQDLSERLVALTGYDAFSLQPNSGAQGEYAGLLAIHAYHRSRGEKRDICLIPSSAHGTNPASAAMVDLKVVVVRCDDQGNIDLQDLKKHLDKYDQRVACMMVTYPSTHGVFEESIKTVCEMVHACGGQIYLDGANLNAQIGLTSPGFIGADVSHLNLHKTFAIPHGGGGPGVGPIGVKKHLTPFMPGHIYWPETIQKTQGQAVCSAPFGSASILTITWAYIAMMGTQGLKMATEIAILNANYIAHRLSDSYPILYRGENGRIAHECIIDLRPLKSSSGISDEDVAKRLMDYGFHAPTMSFPVAGTLMIEPTESECLKEIDRFCTAMIAIREEIDKVEKGTWPLEDNPLVNAPHTPQDIVAANWTHPYSREEAVYPVSSLKSNKFWPMVNRVDNVYGDRNLFCSCIPIDAYTE